MPFDFGKIINDLHHNYNLTVKDHMTKVVDPDICEMDFFDD